MGGYEIIEHTADVGLTAHGDSLEDLLEQATRAHADISGVWGRGPGERTEISVEADDLGSLLVDWLSEVLYLQDSSTSAIAGVHVKEVRDGRARGSLELVPWGDSADEGVQVKAITYHQLEVVHTDPGWRARVFVDV